MRDLDKLNPVVKGKALKLQSLAKERFGLNIIFTMTLRTADEQTALYAQGRKTLAEVNALRAKAGMNPITQTDNKIVTKASTVADTWHGYGLAFDIAITDSTGKKINWNYNADWNQDGKSDWEQVGSLAAECGLEWGGNWSGMVDPPHFQDRFNMTIAQAKLKATPGKTYLA